MRLSERRYGSRALALLWLWLAARSSAQVQLSTQNCLNAGNAAPSSQLLNFSAWYGQLTSEDERQTLRLVGFGETGERSEGYSSTTGFLATIIASNSVASFITWTNDSALCDAITSPDATRNLSDVNGCPYGPGSLAMGLDVPLDHSYPVTSLLTQIRLLDTSSPSKELACLLISSTPYYTQYWFYTLGLWTTAGISIAFGVVTWIGRMKAAHSISVANREAELAASLTTKLSPLGLRERLGPVFWDALAGSTLQKSASLRRFATPGLRDCVWAAQFVVLVGMMAVTWPDFVYPAIAKLGWSFLLFKTAFVGAQVDSLASLSTSQLPAAFTNQLNSATSPIYLNGNSENTLLNLGQSRRGIASLAIAIGLEPRSLFPTMMAIFGICLAIILSFNLGVCAFDYAFEAISRARAPVGVAATSRNNIRYGAGMNSRTTLGFEDSDKDAFESVNGRNSALGTVQSKEAMRHADSSRPLNSWWNKEDAENGQESRPVRLDYHCRALVGNLLRLLLVFHLPICVLSVYQMTLYGTSSTGAFAGATVAFAILVVGVPAFCIFRINRTPEQTLQDDLPTLLVYGTFYNIFGDRSYSFMGVRLLSHLIAGTAVGAGQTQGTAQAIVLLVVEIADTLATSLWLPWGEGAMMGPLAFLFSVARVITAILLIVMTPAVDISRVTASWLAYVILLIQALIFIMLFFVILTKILELVLRTIGHVPFDESRSLRSGGLGGAYRKFDRTGRNRKTHRKSHQALSSDMRQSYVQPRSPPQSPMHSSSPSQSQSRPRYSTEYMSSRGSYYDMPAYPRAFNPETPNADDTGFIMSAMSEGQWQAASYSAYVKPGEDEGNGPQSNEPLAKSSFTVVRGGRATDVSPYTMSGSAGNSSGGPGGRRGPGAEDAAIVRDRPSHHSRPSDDYFDHGRGSSSSYITPNAPTLFSNANRSSSGGLEERHSSSSRKKGGFLGRFGKQSVPEEAIESSDEEDDDEREELTPPTSTGRWPFRRKTPEAEKPAVEPSFAVVRKPRPSPTRPPDSDSSAVV